MSSVGPRGKGCIWWAYGIRNGMIRNGMPWLFLEFDGILLWPLFSICLEKLSHSVGKAAVYMLYIRSLLWSQPVVGRQNPTNLISFLTKQHLQFTGWSAKEFFRGILRYLPPKCGRTPKSVTSSSKHSFWPTSAVETCAGQTTKTLTLLFQWFRETWVKLSWRGALLSHIGYSFDLSLPVLAFWKG